MNQNRKRFYQFLPRTDEMALIDAIDTCQRDYPAQTFVGLDSEMRPSIVAVFDDARGHLDFDFWHFSTLTNAFKAFAELEDSLDG